VSHRRSTAEGNPGGARNFDAVTTPSTGRERSETSTASTGGAGIGRVLRAARVERGASLADLQARTKIRAKFLAALEEERFEDLPPYPFMRGFLQTYARELGVDPEPLVARLASAMSGSAEPVPGDWQRLESAVLPAVPASRLRRLLVSLGVVAFVVTGALGVFFARQFSEFSRPVPAVAPSPAATAEAPEQPALGSGPSVGAAVPTAPSSLAAPPRGSATPSPSPGGEVQGEAGITVEVRASGRSWVRVTAGGQTLFVGFVTAGETQRWQSRGPMTIRLGNAGVVEATVNGKTVGVLGQLGEVIERTFARDGTH
jgi:cytoskeletal protein RodZ